MLAAAVGVGAAEPEKATTDKVESAEERAAESKKNMKEMRKPVTKSEGAIKPARAKEHGGKPAMEHGGTPAKEHGGSPAKEHAGNAAKEHGGAPAKSKARAEKEAQKLKKDAQKKPEKR